MDNGLRCAVLTVRLQLGRVRLQRSAKVRLRQVESTHHPYQAEVAMGSALSWRMRCHTCFLGPMRDQIYLL